MPEHQGDHQQDREHPDEHHQRAEIAGLCRLHVRISRCPNQTGSPIESSVAAASSTAENLGTAPEPGLLRDVADHEQNDQADEDDGQQADAGEITQGWLHQVDLLLSDQRKGQAAP